MDKCRIPYPVKDRRALYGEAQGNVPDSKTGFAGQIKFYARMDGCKIVTCFGKLSENEGAMYYATGRYRTDIFPVNNKAMTSSFTMPVKLLQHYFFNDCCAG
jgi:hypothetical protein